MDPFTQSLKERIAELLRGYPFDMPASALDRKLEAAQSPWHLMDILEKEEAPFGNLILGTVHPTAILEGNVYVAAGAVIDAYCVIRGPAYIGPGSHIGPHAFIRPATIIGAHCHIGTSTVKNSIILSHSNAAHYSYIGDSIVGEHCNFGAGSHTGNLRLDERTIRVVLDGSGKAIDSGRKKLGCIMEDGVHTGCNTVLNPGTHIQSGAMLVGAQSYRGFVANERKK